jgi:nuclear pore complex protein Nup107
MSQADGSDDDEEERFGSDGDLFQEQQLKGRHISTKLMMKAYPWTTDGLQPGFSLHSSTAFDLLQPLQQTAERVSRQVEEFARDLDKFNSNLENSEQQIWVDARSLFQRLSELSKTRLQDTLARGAGTSRVQEGLGGTEGEIQKLQLEANLWALSADLLICNSPDATAEAGSRQETVLNGLHRYSLPTELWNAFLESDTTAQEYEVILGWLQETAEISSPTVDEVLAELNAKAERGDGIWSAGYLYTKNAIKAQKRSRSWAKPLEPTIAGISKIHVRPLDSEPLVTQMDPDAQTRQAHVLLQQDDFHEQYAWQACWEVLRRGYDQNMIQTWWAERKEVWRSVCLRANPMHPDQHNLAFSRIMNLASNRKWSEICRQLCQDSADLYTFQSAVYGIISGDLPATLKACHTIDEGLFAHFNALLIERYKLFLYAWDAKVQDASKSIYTPASPKWTQIRQYLLSCQADDLTRAESLEPHRAIEAALMSQDFEAFFVRMGQAAAQVAHLTRDNAHLMAKNDESPKDDCAHVTAGDFDSVRIVAHLQLVLHSLGYLDEVYEKHLYTVENNIANYIGWLQREGKFELIPMYASHLSKDRVAHVLGAILGDVKVPKERDVQVKLMKKYNINVPEVLWGNFCITNASLLAKLQDRGIAAKFPRITEHVGTGIVKNIKIRPRFMGSNVKDEETVAIETLEWFRYTNAENWGQACWAVAALYMSFLTEGRLAAASSLAERVYLSDMSLAALKMNLNIAEASDDEDVDMDIVSREESHKTKSPSKKRKHAPNLLLLPGKSREQLASKSLVWLQLEQLISVLNAFDRWIEAEMEMEEYVFLQCLSNDQQLTKRRNRNNPSQMRVLKRELLKYLGAIQELMSPLLDEDFLCRPNDETEGAVLDDIRNHYLPECILAFDSVLYYAGHALSRKYLVECMNLAQLVASSSTLTKAFVESKRMQELVTAFAVDSKALLHANEIDGGKKAKKDSGIDIWQIKGLSLNEATDLDPSD